MIWFEYSLSVFFTDFFYYFFDVLCRDGATGDEIVEALIANSSTYENKTVFSQVSLEITV